MSMLTEGKHYQHLQDKLEEHNWKKLKTYDDDILVVLG